MDECMDGWCTYIRTNKSQNTQYFLSISISVCVSLHCAVLGKSVKKKEILFKHTNTIENQFKGFE